MIRFEWETTGAYDVFSSFRYVSLFPASFCVASFVSVFFIQLSLTVAALDLCKGKRERSIRFEWETNVYCIKILNYYFW